MSQPYLRRNLHLQPEKHQASTTTVRELICVYAANAQNTPNMQSDVTDLDFLESLLVSFPTVETWATPIIPSSYICILLACPWLFRHINSLYGFIFLHSL